MMKTARRLAASCLLLFFMAGNALAQTNGQFVIKTGTGTNTHFLSHEGNALGDATVFSPSVLWTSDNTYTQGGANRNYYFMEGTTPHFLGAPTFEPFGALSLSPSLPLGNQLSNPESQYYFYRWDDGLGRGVQFYGVTSEWCNNNHPGGWNSNNECWQVYWVEYNTTAGEWKLSDESYNITTNGGRFYPVTITEHGNDTTIVMVNEMPSGLQALQGFEMEYSASPLTTQQVTPSITDYQYTVRPAYTTYVFDGSTHHYYSGSDHESIPDLDPHGPVSVRSYAWTLSGDGADYLSFGETGTYVHTSNANAPTIYYRHSNDDGHKTATLTLTVTYSDDSKQRSSATILVKTPCHNPTLLPNPTVSYVGVTVSWTPTAESYLVSWRKQEQGTTSWNSHAVGNVTSYTITGLEYGANYDYRVQATSCETSVPETSSSFTTLAEPGLMVTGAIFGGGRMADVGGKTEVVIINFDSIGTVYGGNDIAGSVLGAEGSTITLGVNSGDTYASYGTTTSTVNAPLWLGSVYGGGNGFYTYDGNAPGAEIGTSVLTDGQFHSSATEVGGGDCYATSGTIPAITKTAIVVRDDYVKVDSIFGGARNAFVTLDNTSQNGSSIIINGGTILAVYGGNNVGGSQKKGKHYIEVNKTTTNLSPNIANTNAHGYGRDFGIRSLFGGGNKVEGSSTDIHIKGGQMDNVFAGGNAADVYYANVTIECNLGTIPSGVDYTFGDTYTNAIDPMNYTSGTIGASTLYSDYAWDGISGIYNVRTLYGGNNEAEMQRVPNINLTSGSVGTVYGGGNAGDMMGSASTTISTHNVLYSTHVVLNSNQVLVDYIYGGCRMSNVFNSTWVELKKGHVGTVYGGCNISGDVGSTRVNPNAPNVPTSLEDQRVLGATYVQAGAGGTDTDLIVYKDLYAGSNGYYHCTSDGIHYNADDLFDTPSTLYAGMEIPTHNETNVMVSNGTTVKGNVYAGGNLAPVGFYDNTGFYRGYPELVGMATVNMTGGRVVQNVYGGGNMASIYGRNEVKVSGGSIGYNSDGTPNGGALYGGNDRAGQVAERTNRKLPTGYGYTVASDNATSLETGVMTFVGVSGNAKIVTVYGGGNGDYTYGGENGIPYCGETPSQPIQPYTFVDIHINGGENGGKIGTVYGGGNGVTVRGGAIVFMNIVEPSTPEDFNNVDTIFGGNNKGDLVIVPDIRLVHGQVGTVYGGCNRGAMTADNNVNVNGTTVNYLQTIGGYENIGSYVRLRNTYNPTNPAGTGGSVDVTAKVTEAIYGGCRMNGVTRNSLVLVEGGNFSAIPIFGGSDISGTVSGFSRVAVTGGTVGNVYGGGNGNYDYVSGGNVYRPGSAHTAANLVATGITAAPICASSGADILGGFVGTAALLADRTVSQVFGGGWGQGTRTTGNVIVNVGRVDAANAAATPTIYGDIYGGSAFGTVNSNNENTTIVNFYNGALKKATVSGVDYGGNLYGGGLGRQAVAAVTDPETGVTTPAVEPIAALVKGKVFVKIGDESQTDDNCFIDLRQANIFGCNNANGSPQDSVRVDVWRTAYNFSDYLSGDGYTSQYVASSGVTPLYAIDQVFGGGNQADYAPENGSASSTRKTWVYVHNCLNTIRRVFSGGNAAAATGVKATIEGGRMDYIFGGGNGEVSAANIGAGGTDLLVEAGIIEHLFGGSNQTGSITGPVRTVIDGDKIGDACAETIAEFYGGSNEANLNSSVTTLLECGCGLVGVAYGGCNLANIEGNVSFTIRGGQFTEVYGGSKGRAADNTATPPIEAKAANITGNVTLNLEGGEITDAFGGSNINGNITGNILVNVVERGGDCGLDLTNVYGGGNLTPYTPTNASSTNPVVNVIHIAQADGIRGNVYGGAKGSTARVTAHPIVNIGYDATTMSSYVTGLTIPASPRAYVKGSVFGGGDAAPVTGSTTVNVFKGEIVHKLVGGGNAADVTANATINVTGGSICTEPTGVGAGVYGGCNTSGNVGGNITVNIDGSSTIPTTIGTQAALQAVAVAGGNPISVHGGGYGVGTSTNGNVTINFGSDVTGESSAHNQYLNLYGDMYGGSALGTVNDNVGEDKTTVTILNGSVKYYMSGNTQYGGNIYGGGLGDDDHAATVNGEVHVNIGGEPEPGTTPVALIGKASLKHCNVFGCNNQNGSPQKDVFVDVYQTNHTSTDCVDCSTDDFAINTVYGGGNMADYAPTANPSVFYALKAKNTIHYCENTIGTVYGGGRAAAADGVDVMVDGGRFEYIFGGGNGQMSPANIGYGGITLTVCSGHVGWKYVGCDMGGNVLGTQDDRSCAPEDKVCDGDLVADYFFFGANKATIIGGLVDTIFCDPDNPMTYENVYAGSRLATVYGDIFMVVQGGEITNLYGGSQGSLDRPGHVKKFPDIIHDPELINTVPEDARADMQTYLSAHPEAVGTGGNIYLKLQGGTIQNVYGGTQLCGNIDGKIIVEVDSISTCPLTIGYLYGGTEKALYEPDLEEGECSPQVYIKNGSVQHDVYGGSMGDRYGEMENAGRVTSSPYVVVGNDASGTTNKARVGENVFGGGNLADVIGNTEVVLRGKATVGSDVFGGSRSSDVDGNTKVKIAPATSYTPVMPPPPTPVPHRFEYGVNIPGSGTIEVTNSHGQSVSSPAQIAQGAHLHIVARSSDVSQYAFSHWGIEGGGAVASSTEAFTSFFMGTSDVVLTANFVPVRTLTLTADPSGAGTFKVNGEVCSGTASIPQGIPVTIEAIPAEGHTFSGWTLVSGTGTTTTPDEGTPNIISFTIGAGNASLKANFE